MIKERKTKFGHITTITGDEHDGVELILFDREGRDHVHEEWEHAVCIQGPCDIVANGFHHRARLNQLFSIAPGIPHRMIPRTKKRSTWLIWYSKTLPVHRMLHQIIGEL